MLDDSTVLIGLGCAALLVVWLVFSLLKKAVGLIVLAALAVAAYMVWSNPALLDCVLGWFGAR